MGGWALFAVPQKHKAPHFRASKMWFLNPIYTGGRTVVLMMFWSDAGTLWKNWVQIRSHWHGAQPGPRQRQAPTHVLLPWGSGSSGCCASQK